MTLYYFLKPDMFEKYTLLSSEELASLDDVKTISEKIEKLISMLEIPATEFNERRSTCTELRELLRKYYPDCLLHMFGSSMAGFGAKNSNLDLLFLPFPGYCNLDYAKSEKGTIPEPANVLSGEVSGDVLSKLDEFSHLKFIRAVLRREKEHVKKVAFVPSRCPTLKVFMKNNKVFCDLSASSMLVVFNSELMQFFEKLDNRVKPLVMILRFWARSLGFIKKSYFTNYAFTLLVIFFLQDISPPVLPSVKHLTEIAGFSRMTIGWQTAFTTDVKLIPPSKNTKTVGELLMQFFEYFWNFDFVQNIVSPHAGKVVSIKDVKGSSDERVAGFEIASFNIQDPFILSDNVCGRKGTKIIFKLALFTACQMLQDKSQKYKFSMLFDASEYQKVLDLHYNRYMFGKPKVFFINLEYDCASKHDFSKYAGNPQLWYHRVSEAVFDVLQYGLLVECEVTDKISWGKKVPASSLKDKALKQENSPYNLELLMSIQCVLYSRTWVGRKNVTEVTMNGDSLEDFSGSALKAEYNISKELVTKNPSINSSIPLLCFQCECYKHGSPQIPDVVILLRPLMYSREFHQVSGFLSSYIPRTVKKILASDE